MPLVPGWQRSRHADRQTSNSGAATPREAAPLQRAGAGPRRAHAIARLGRPRSRVHDATLARGWQFTDEAAITPGFRAKPAARRSQVAGRIANGAHGGRFAVAGLGSCAPCKCAQHPRLLENSAMRAGGSPRRRAVGLTKTCRDRAPIANDSPKRRIAAAYSKTFPDQPARREKSCVAFPSPSFCVPPYSSPPAATTHRPTLTRPTPRRRPAHRAAPPARSTATRPRTPPHPMPRRSRRPSCTTRPMTTTMRSPPRTRPHRAPPPRRRVDSFVT
ncbi:Uncharacterised protein [Clostridium sporogenes]|nr:Uncharacterised protein [Clostridium sporogenes]